MFVVSVLLLVGTGTTHWLCFEVAIGPCNWAIAFYLGRVTLQITTLFLFVLFGYNCFGCYIFGGLIALGLVGLVRLVYLFRSRERFVAFVLRVGFVAWWFYLVVLF